MSTRGEASPEKIYVVRDSQVTSYAEKFYLTIWSLHQRI